MGDKGRTSRASSTSSLGREVRCGCQFYQSDSLLPERKALVGRPSSRNAMQPTSQDQEGRCDHEYEPIATPAILAALQSARSPLNTAPVVRISDTDVEHVADSDESIDVQDRRWSPKLVLDGDVVVPLDGEIEDNAMQARELGENADTSEDQETAQQMQDRLEERFLNAATPCTESRTDAEINTSQVDSSALEELPLRRGARRFSQQVRNQAGKLRSQLRGIQRPTFSLPGRHKTEKTKTTKAEKETEKEKPKAKPKPKPKSGKSRFSLPERPKFNFPDRSKFSLPERPKFNIKRPNIHLPKLGRTRKSIKDVRQSSMESNTASKRNIFDSFTYPRIFDRKSGSRGDYATSSPKDSRAQSPESATVPRLKKKTSIGASWVKHFSDIKYADEEPDTAVERSRPWRHPSIEEPQIALRQETPESREHLPWEESEESRYRPREDEEDEVPEHVDEDLEYEEDSEDRENRRIIVELPLGHNLDDVPDPRHYPRGLEEESYEDEDVGVVVRGRGGNVVKDEWAHGSNRLREDEVHMEEERDLRGPDSYEGDEYSEEIHEDVAYGGDFRPIDPPRKYLEREVTPEDNSLRSDREQQSSGSSCDRRRRGVLEEIDSDEFYQRAKGDHAIVDQFLTGEIREAFAPPGNALADLDLHPPMRPLRTRSLRKQRRDEDVLEPEDLAPPAPPKRDRRRSEESLRRLDEFYEKPFLPEKTSSVSGSRHRVIYQAEGAPRAPEILDDIVIVKPARRKSRSVARSQSEFGSSILQPLPLPPTPPVAPRRRKRGRRDAKEIGDYVNGHGRDPAVCNGHQPAHDWHESINFHPEVTTDPDILSHEQLQTLVNRLDHEYIEPSPVAPKRKSRSRGTSVADDDRTSRGAESLPEGGYLDEDDTPRDNDSRDLPGYAVVEKREKPPRPPPPRRRRDKFATSPRNPKTPAVPVRPIRAYSTLGPLRRRSTSEDRSVNQTDVTPYTELDSDDPDSLELRTGQNLNKIQGRPLPAPPRPPRARREVADQVSLGSNGVAEVAASTQTDPLPDDMMIEEEVTTAKLVMAPSRSGSQILVSTERVATPTSFGRNSPAVPPLPQSIHRERFEATPSPISEQIVEPLDDRHGVEEEEQKINPAESRAAQIELQLEPRPPTSLSLGSHEDRIRIASLEVADLRVERLNVNQLEAHKISASEVDAVVVSASEISGNSNSSDAGIHPLLLRELIAIRSHLEQAASARLGQGQQAAKAEASETTTESIQRQAVDEKTKDRTSSAVSELIEALKNSDQKEEPMDLTEDSEKIEEETTKESESIPEPQKSIGESQLGDENVEMIIEQSEISGTEEIAVNQVPQATPELGRTHGTQHQDSTPGENHISTSLQESTELKPVPAFETQNTEKGQVPQSLSMTPDTSKSKNDKDGDPTTGPPPGKDDGQQERCKSSRSRSSSPTKDGKRPVRQTASPVKSLPPLISVTPDTPDPLPSPVPQIQVQPQRGVVSYVQSVEEEVPQRPSVGMTQYVAFPTSQIPANFFSLASPVDSSLETEPSILEGTQQVLRAIRLAGTRAMRHFVGYVASRVSTEDRGEKTKEIELALCALLLLIAGLLILCFGSPRTVTHHHHWDYFNPPQ